MTASGGGPPSGEPDQPGLARPGLGAARERAGLSAADMYLRYVSLGGAATAMQFAEHCATGSALTAGEHDIAVLALNERFLEMNMSERLPYSR